MVYPIIQRLNVLCFRHLAYFVHVGLRSGRQLFQRAPLVAESEQGQEVYLACLFPLDAIFRYGN